MKSAIVIFPLFVLGVVCAQEKIVTIQVTNGDFARINTPLSISLDGAAINVTDQLLLFQVVDGRREHIPCQLIPGDSPRLYWIIEKIAAKEILTFELATGDPAGGDVPFFVQSDEQKLLIHKNGKKVLQYNCAEVYPPPGVSDMFKRSGFIHPVWSPDGSILSRIQPPDHYHHYGIWGPWTKTQINGRSVDFWNLGEGQGTVRFSGLMSVIEGAVYSGFKVLQEHIDFGARGRDKTAINEILDVRVWNFSSETWLVDYTITFNCPSDSVLLDAYRYGGGIGFRAVESWTNQNVRVLTSEGKTRVDADGSLARWCDVSGADENGQRAGIVFLSHPNNRSHPEPMRVWPEDANNGRGDMFFEFCPIRHESWQLAPGRDYVLKYRMLVYDGAVDAATAEAAWQDFAHPPVAAITAIER